MTEPIAAIPAPPAAPSVRKHIIAYSLLAFLLVASNAATYMVMTREVSRLDNVAGEARAASEFYRALHRENIEGDINWMNDDLAVYVSKIKDVKSAMLRRNRSDALAAVDSLNIAAGSLSGYATIANLKSYVINDRFSGYQSDRMLKADELTFSEMSAEASGRVGRMISYKKKLLEIKPGQELPARPK